MRLVFDHVLDKSGICSVNGNFLGPTLSQGSCLEPPHAHGLCPLTDSLKDTVSSAGAGGNTLLHLLPTLRSHFGYIRSPFYVWLEFEFLQLT